MIILSILSFALAVICYTISQLAQHGKIKWKSKDPHGFWGESMDRRKYKNFSTVAGERWPTSTNLTVFLTDGYHFCQFMFFNLLALAFTLAIGFNLWLLAGMLIGIRLVHGAVYKYLSK
jgi:hypothetical protein